MPLWGSNTASAAAKPKWLANTGTYYNKADVIGANASYTDSQEGIAHKGWVHVKSVGNIVEFEIQDGGLDYQNGDQVFASNVGSVDAVGTLVVDPDGSILMIIVENSGSVANASVAAGAVISIQSNTGSDAVITLAYVEGSGRLQLETLVAL